MGDGALEDGRVLFPWPAAIFLLVGILQLVDRRIGRLKKVCQRESRTAEENQLIQEIKELLKQASLLSTPSSFAQAAKLKRMATAKQKELVKRRMLSWRAGDPATDAIKVGIIPWLVLTNRVSKFLSQKLPDLFL